MSMLLEITLSNALVAVVLALAAAIVGRLCRRPALTHSLWVLVLCKLITPPLMPVPVAWFSAPERVAPEAPSLASAGAIPQTEPALSSDPNPLQGETNSFPLSESAAGAALPRPAESPVAPADAPKVEPASAPASWTPSWQLVVLAVWVTGSALWLALAGVRIYRFRRLLRFATPASAELQEQIESMAERLGLARCPRAWLMPGAVSPMLWGLIGTPRLFLPSDLWARLNENQRDTLLAHELAHVRRRDHWVRRLELLVMALYWWHPVVWWARREIREAEEQCCDAWVVWALPALAETYARTLVDTVDFLSEARPALPLAASGIGHVQHLRRRLTMIMHGTTPRALTWGGCMAVLAAGALLLLLRPTVAQDDVRRPRGGERPTGDRPPAERPTGDRPAGERRDREPLPPQRAAEIEKARVEVQKLAAEMEKMQAQLHEAAARMRQAQERLADLEGRRPEGPDPFGRPRDFRGPDGRPGGPPPGGDRRPEGPPPPGGERRPDGPPLGGVGRPVGPPPGGERRPDGPPPGGGDRPFGPGGGEREELERKIERLMREIEELRREVRKEPRDR